jgi:hypothetical protein
MTKQIKDDAKIFVEVWRKWKNARTEASIRQHENRLFRMADVIIKRGHYEVWVKEVTRLLDAGTRKPLPPKPKLTAVKKAKAK